MVEDSFLDYAPDSKMDTLYKSVQNIITNASYFETNLGLKRVAVKAMERYLAQNITKNWTEAPAVGTAAVDEAPTVEGAEAVADIADNNYGLAQKIQEKLEKALYFCDRELISVSDSDLAPWCPS